MAEQESSPRERLHEMLTKKKYPVFNRGEMVMHIQFGPLVVVYQNGPKVAVATMPDWLLVAHPSMRWNTMSRLGPTIEVPAVTLRKR
jgi:hypothetical protein